MRDCEIQLLTAQTDSFYSRLKSFSNFEEVSHDRHFVSIPEDWFILVTDVEGSTTAIHDGRYKDVNTLGAASIAAVQSVMGDEDFPSAFGGDGAVLAIPPQHLDAAVAALAALKSLSHEQFNLAFRVGKVPVSDLIQEGVRTEVAKFELASGKCIAIFRGGGVARAEHKLKDRPKTYGIEELPRADVSLRNLSCRWNAIPSRNGRILSMLVLARTGHDHVYRDLLATLETVLNGGLGQANPVNVPTMSYKSVRECVTDERRYHTSIWSASFWGRCLEIFAAVLIFKFKFHPLVMNPSEYTNALNVHSDYRKFADMFRAVIDCSPENIFDIRQYLEARHEAGDLYYGLYESETALMTCYVNSTAPGKHIHFIDGGNGGYTQAAIQLKVQMKTEERVVCGTTS
ncbi:MAG TPA: DUF3095 family protein [Nitrospiraceae bacterium]